MKFSWLSFILGFILGFLIFGALLLFVWPKGEEPVPSPSSQTKGLACEEAISKVGSQPEVSDFLKRVPNGKISCDSQEQDGTWLIHVYEIVRDHTATFGWYTIKPDGTVESAM